MGMPAYLAAALFLLNSAIVIVFLPDEGLLSPEEEKVGCLSAARLTMPGTEISCYVRYILVQSVLKRFGRVRLISGVRSKPLTRFGRFGLDFGGQVKQERRLSQE
eukprot:2462414-Rhodomonas_salina.1